MISWEGDIGWTGIGESKVKEPRWGITATVEGKVTFSFTPGTRGPWCQC